MVHLILPLILYYIYLTAPFQSDLQHLLILPLQQTPPAHPPQSSHSTVFLGHCARRRLTLSAEQAVSPPIQTQMHLLLHCRGFRLIRALFCAAAVLEWFTATAQLQHHVADLHWLPATATWYGSPEGDGSDGTAVPFPYIFFSFWAY